MSVVKSGASFSQGGSSAQNGAFARPADDVILREESTQYYEDLEYPAPAEAVTSMAVTGTVCVCLTLDHARAA